MSEGLTGLAPFVVLWVISVLLGMAGIHVGGFRLGGLPAMGRLV